ncbi:SAM-dependent methyltransferase [Rhizobium sp. BK196]|uniref:class I SAM-dependent methyltransferase n=1 Tax=Rhizobium sp. BK196 TaxID=2587073 RepID=UPI0016114FF8|nr:class I SAM-dependent methyltransferase [Rhizobium sp. BK196]MBB3308805.1 SAM-dependent methyltransferase [Rhizobium sp. BK196]
MSGDIIARSFGRQAFGLSPENYQSARPPYPHQVWDLLRKRAGLRSGIAILEIGAGTGLATEHLLDHEPRRLLAVEPDRRLAEFLRARLHRDEFEVIEQTFEELAEAPQSFDLVVSATAFHWLDAVPALRRIHALLRDGGAVALIWNVFGDNIRPDPFHEASAHLFAGHRPSPSGGGTVQTPYGLDSQARISDFEEASFQCELPVMVEWTLTLDPPAVRRLYATYSNVVALEAEKREALLDALEDIARADFGGVVTRNMTTSVFIARRK